jgi:exodeoxyribonuclease VII small subunit
MNQKPFEFEQSLKELEQITAWFESSDVDLDQGLIKFERGMELASLLKDHLLTVENRVEKIRQRFSGQTTESAVQQSNEAPLESGTDQPDLFEM